MTLIATWNVNSIRQRITHLLDYLKDQSPDILLLQETKVIDEAFPRMELEDAGYNLAIHGQKTFNGVAILSKTPLDDISIGLPGNDNDDHARYIEAVTTIDERVLRIASVYVPNGSEVGSDKFAHKMEFFDRMLAQWERWLSYEEACIMGGDYNIAPSALDVYAPDKLNGTVCYHEDERAKIRTIMNRGITDAYRAMHPDRQEFSWWDYRGGGWQQNKGLRIDHLLLSPQATDMLCDAGIDTQLRAADKASDHTVAWAKLH